MNHWSLAASITALCATIFFATAPQRELANRELARQDALVSQKQLLEERVRQSNDLLRDLRLDP
jgi:hypothetical protein